MTMRDPSLYLCETTGKPCHDSLVCDVETIAELHREIRGLRARVAELEGIVSSVFSDIQDQMDVFRFANGLSVKQASVALVIARNIVEECEQRHSAARASKESGGKM